MNDKQFARTKAIAVLECMAIDLTGALAESSKTNPMTEVLEQRLEAIDTAQTALREQPQWISVEEKLPEVGERFIGCGAKGGVFLGRQVLLTSAFAKVDGASSHRNYTHWMPLPEPPKEEV